MKKLLIPFLMLISFNLYAQPWKIVAGNGNLKNEVRQVTEFTSLYVRGSMDVQIEHGTSNSIKVEADENLLPYIETIVKNGELVIQPKNNVQLKSRSKIVVHVSMIQINGLKLSGSGNITGNGPFTNSGETEMSVSGSGDIHLNTVDFNDLDASVSGSGNIRLEGGSVNTLKISVSGSGNIDCSKAESKSAEVKISGSGNAKVMAEKSLDARISGSGNVYYKGSPASISTKIMGSGRAIKM